MVLRLGGWKTTTMEGRRLVLGSARLTLIGMTHQAGERVELATAAAVVNHIFVIAFVCLKI